MIIIIEGPDGSGKSTLAQSMSRQTGWPIEHRSKPKNEAEKLNMMKDYMKLAKSKRNVILDRCWYSEMVYGKVMRDQSYISYSQMYELERLLMRHGAMLIHCTGDKDLLWKRATTRGEYYITAKEKFDAIYDEYNDIMNCPHYIPVVTYEYKGM